MRFAGYLTIALMLINPQPWLATVLFLVLIAARDRTNAALRARELGLI